MPLFSKGKIHDLKRIFVVYVNFPKNGWSEIKKIGINTSRRQLMNL
tara:strand:+ start:882 stop:1019 length:138 start_codon:yes stop_codon:yes gene_type:complete